jgi:nucleoside 2-deoxyribosyltransferase
MKAYLAHSFASRFEVRDEITPIIEEMFSEYEIMNPFLREDRENTAIFEYEGTSEEELAKHREKENVEVDYRNQVIVEGDLKDVEECDILICYVDDVLSFGAPCEIFYASYTLKKPVYMIFKNKSSGLYHHPWVNYLATEMIILEE